MKYPISVQDKLHDGRMSRAFVELLKLHIQPGSLILDPTAGSHLLWQAYTEADNDLIKDIDPPYEIKFSDIKGGEENIIQNLAFVQEDWPEWEESFDCVVYDPPYLIGENATNDPREEKYGAYCFSEEDLKAYMAYIPRQIRWLLKPKGRLILKCSDQYVVSQRKFYPHHYEWMRRMVLSFTIIDIMIYRHHRMSPTAFQVKNRPCSVVMHTYYIVGEKNDE